MIIGSHQDANLTRDVVALRCGGLQRCRLPCWFVATAVMARPSASILANAFREHTYQNPFRMCPSSRSNCSPQTSTPLSCVQSALLLVQQRLLTPLHDLLAFCQDHLDVTRVAHVWIDSAVSSVCSTSLFGCLIDLDMFNDQVAGIEAFDISVGFGILEKSEKEFSRFDRVAGTGDSELFACSDGNVSDRQLLVFAEYPFRIGGEQVQIRPQPSDRSLRV